MKKQILLGTLLGDAYIRDLYGRAKTYKIGWEHCIMQEPYAIWKAKNSLDNYSIYKRERFDKRTEKFYKSIICKSIKDDYKQYRELFYVDGVKQITDNILLELNDLAIAVWFMDDGNLYYNGNICHLTISTNSFNNESITKILEFFKFKYNLDFKLLNNNAIRLTSVKQVLLFESFFKNYYHVSMLYKTLDYNKEKYMIKKKLNGK